MPTLLHGPVVVVVVVVVYYMFAVMRPNYCQAYIITMEYIHKHHANSAYNIHTA